jgi:molybdopterin-guanine dinucleotide biosynthesis protein A
VSSATRSPLGREPQSQAPRDPVARDQGGPASGGSGSLPVSARRLALGVLLCGGKSSRMGSDKGRLELAGESLLQRSAALLAEVADEVLLVSRTGSNYADLGWSEVADLRPGGGPLAGLETALALANERGIGMERHVALLACDMPSVTPRLFERLVAKAARDEFDVVLPRGPRGWEPLIGLYRVGVLAAVRAELDRGERRMISIHAGHGLRVGEIEDCSETTNVNTPADWQRFMEAER